ncbi:hypothetical protein EYF80_032191 [Liparis tanakae]|uniref:Uncharacterized protein n=1 Tax=Liparis tanakae TaxID=230148 RepID=A0A4Z2GVV9_9TELE|nr:hypothetical protein EYF80_032191 [Liparis tanakae]
MDSLELLLSLRCLPVGQAQLDLHFIEVSLHLLFHPESLVSAASLSLQRALQSVRHPQVVTLGLIHLLVLLSQLPLDFGLHLVELKLGSEDLTLLMLKGALLKAVMHCLSFKAPESFLESRLYVSLLLLQLFTDLLQLVDSLSSLTKLLSQRCSSSIRSLHVHHEILNLTLKPVLGFLQGGTFSISSFNSFFCILFDDVLHVGHHIIQLQPELALLFLQLLLDSLQVVNLLSQRRSGGFVLESGLFEVSAHLLKLRLPLLVHLDLDRRGSSGLLQPLTDLLQLSRQVSPLFLHLGPGSSLCLQLFLQLFNASLDEMYPSLCELFAFGLQLDLTLDETLTSLLSI